jgi:hypothetical protein
MPILHRSTSLVASPSFSCLNLTKKRKEKNKRQEAVDFPWVNINLPKDFPRKGSFSPDSADPPPVRVVELFEVSEQSYQLLSTFISLQFK